MITSTLRRIIATFLAITWLAGFPPRIHSEVNPNIDESLFKNYYISSDEISDTDRESTFQMLRRQLDSPLSLRKLLLLDDRRLKLLRNEIFARHGYIFESADLREYFNAMLWYKPNNNFNESLLTQIDKQNVDLIKKYEFVKNELSFETEEKHAGKNSWVDKLDKSQKKLNLHIDKIQNGIRFKQSKKELRFRSSKQKEEIGGKVEKYVNQFQNVETFNDIPIIFVRTWRFVRMIGDISEKVEAYDIDGAPLFAINLSQKDIWYDKESELFIAEKHENWSGETHGSICIFDKQGNILFNENAYGVEFILPLWSKLKLIYVPSGKLVTIGPSGQLSYQPIFNFPNLIETYGAGDATKRKIAMIAPNVIYWAGLNDYWPEGKDRLIEGLIFLDELGPSRENGSIKKVVTINWKAPRPDKSINKINEYIEYTKNGIRFKSTSKEVAFYKETHRDRVFKNDYYTSQIYQDVETFKTTSIVFVRTWFSLEAISTNTQRPPGASSVKIDGYDKNGNHIFSINMPYKDIWYNKEKNLFLAVGDIDEPSKIAFDMYGNIVFHQDH